MTSMYIPEHTRKKIKPYLTLLKDQDHRELTPEEKIQALQLMERAKNELFIQALFTLGLKDTSPIAPCAKH